MEKILKYYAFDWDDNILHMPTPIHMVYKGVPKDILPGQFAKIRKKPNWALGEKAFDEFRDYGPRGVNGFLNDIKIAISKQNFGPSWNQLIQSIVNGHIIMIITARGHEPNILRNAVRYIISNCLTPEEKITMTHNIKILAQLYHENPPKNGYIDWYLDQCMFVGIYSKYFEDTFKISLAPAQTEKAKEMILNYLITQINEKNQKLGYKFTVGMSDDDVGNISVIKKFFRKSSWSNVVGLYVYDTSNPNKIIKSKYGSVV